MPDLSRIGDREKLKPKAGDEPHWHRLRQGVYVGFRPSKKMTGGTWFARFYDGETNRNKRKSLGDYGTLSGHEVFKQAKADAETWAATVESGGELARDMVTVKDACEAYLKDKPNPIAEGVFRRHVYDDPIAKVKLEKLRRHHLRSWRTRLEQAPAMLSRSKKGEKRWKLRAKSTVNRDMVPLRAALGKVIEQGRPSSDAAWQEALIPFKAADKPRDLYLDKGERRKLVGSACVEVRAFVRGMCLLPLRPGALASLKVRDFNRRTHSLIIGQEKGKKPRQIVLPKRTADFFVRQVINKVPEEAIFSRANGKAWTKDTWKHPIKEAVVRAGLPGGASAYTIRHSVVTDLVRARLPILTVAQLAGTSVAMIERYYGHLVKEDAVDALASLDL